MSCNELNLLEQIITEFEVLFPETKIETTPESSDDKEGG